MDRRLNGLATLPDDPLERLRLRKGAREADAVAASALFQAYKRRLQRQRSRAAWAVEAFLQRCPRGLAERVAAVSLRSGTLTIAPRDAASRYELDRWLRAGGEQEIISASRGPLQRVRLTTTAARGDSGVALD